MADIERSLENGCEDERVDEFAQGDIFAVERLPVIGGIDGGCPDIRMVDCSHGVVLISQTCDCIRSETLQVAPIVTMPDNVAKQYATGKSSRYVPLNLDGKTAFADLELVATLNRGCLEKLGSSGTAVPHPEDKRLARDLIARRFGRFPFPDEVVDWCRPLQEKVVTKVRRKGYQGELLQKISSIRVEEEHNWRDTLVYALSLAFLVEPGTLPLDGEEGEVDALSTDVNSLLEVRDPGDRAERIAQRIVRADEEGLDASSVCRLWQGLIDSWLVQCDEAYGGLNRITRVTGKGMVVSEDEYTFDRYRRSEQLDLDHLSRGLSGSN